MKFFEGMEGCYFGARAIRDFAVLKKLPLKTEILDIQINMIEQWQANRLAGEIPGQIELDNITIIVNNILALYLELHKMYGKEWYDFCEGSYKELMKKGTPDDR